MLNEQDIQMIQATGVDRQTVELLATEQYARRRAEQLLANQQAAISGYSALPRSNHMPHSTLAMPGIAAKVRAKERRMTTKRTPIPW